MLSMLHFANASVACVAAGRTPNQPCGVSYCMETTGRHLGFIHDQVVKALDADFRQAETSPTLRYDAERHEKLRQQLVRVASALER